MGSRDVVDEIRASVSLPEYLSSELGVELRQAGGRLKGLCIFHEERTGSFTVDPERNLYHCFGCGAGGDVFRLVMERGGFTFPEAIEHLAQFAGIEYERGRENPSVQRYRSVLEYAQDFFQKKAASSSGAQLYLRERGLSEETVASWGLGFAPEGSELRSAIDRAGVRGVDRRTAMEVGLITNYGDVFQRRIMFPVADHLGKLVGFAGRTTIINHKEVDVPKYWNTREFALYKKSRVLYGLHRARDAIRDAGEAVVTEGYLDVLMAHQSGLRHIVGTAGTAFTKEHAALLRRITGNVLFLFDNDAAGKKSALSAARVAYGAGLTPRIGLLGGDDAPDKYDLDDLLRTAEDPRGTFEEVQKHGIVDFYLMTLERTPESPDKKLAVVDEAIELFSLEPRASRRMLWLSDLAERLEVPATVIDMRYAEAIMEKEQRKLRKDETKAHLLDDPRYVSAYFVASLVSLPSGEIRHTGLEIPPEAQCFSPPLREVYRAILRNSELMHRSLTEGAQMGLFHRDDARDILGFLDEEAAMGRISDIPPEIIRIVTSGLRWDHGRARKIVKGWWTTERMEGLLAEVRKARVANNAPLEAELTHNLEALMREG